MTIRRWDATTGALLGVLESHSEPVVCLLIVGHFLISGSEDKTLRQWDLKAGQLLRTIDHTAPVTCILSVAGSIFGGCRDSTIRRWSLETGELEATLLGGCRNKNPPSGEATQDSVEDICILCLFTASGYVFSGCRDGSIAKWDLAKNQLLAKLGGADE